MIELRCPGCRKLLAERHADGAVEIRQRGRRRAVIVSGSVVCPRCELGVIVDPPRERVFRAARDRRA